MTNRQICPQCGDIIQSNAKRVVRDSCGHEKCRVCLLLEVEGCQRCRKENGTCQKRTKLLSADESLPKTINPATVITHNIRQELKTNFGGTSQEVVKNHQIRNIERSDLDTTKDHKKSNTISESNVKPLRHTSSKRTYNKTSIPSHIIVNGKPPIFECVICSSKFKTKNHVKYHEFCSLEIKPYSCNVCSKMFILKAQLHIHQLLHLGKKLHICRVCDKPFTESAKLKRHMILHSDKKPYVCDECGKQFKTAGSLKLHGITHTKEKPYSCEYCNMKFNNSSNLKKHIILHSDQRAHMCERCGKKFKQKLALNVHRRSHLQRRDFSCKTCSKAFVNNKDLKRHELVHSDTTLYSCGLCSVSFRRKDNLRRHIRNTHPNEKAEAIEKNEDIPREIERIVVDNPNAINVITSSPLASRNENSSNKIVSTPRVCINGPLKLAFKTSAFRRNYNINRDYIFDSNLEGHHEIPSTSRNIRTSRICTPGIFSSCFSTSNLLVNEFYASRPYVVKNIKFKIPENYPNRDTGLFEPIITTPSVSSSSHSHKELEDRDELNSIARRDCESNIENLEILAVAPTSVIVNTSSQKTIHWRRRMTQNIATQGHN